MTPDPAIEATRMREVLAHYPTGVVVIAATQAPLVFHRGGYGRVAL